MRIRTLLLATGAGIAALVSQPALAQATDDGASDRNAEIIVTARKKAESILNVPVVENVVTEVQIERYAINDIQDVITKVPGLVSGNAVLAIGEQMSLRGVGSNALNQGVDQSVALNVDGLSLTHGLAYRAATFDLQQVEVFKGPQALYYGKNSTAGVISLRSADPTSEFMLKGSFGYELEADEKRGELIVSGPITDTLGIRIAGLYSHSIGFFNNTARAQPGTGAKDPKFKRFGGGESYLIRTTLAWKPSDTLSVRLKANVSRDNYNQGGSNQLASCLDPVNPPPTLTPPAPVASVPANLQFVQPTENCKFDRNMNFVDMDPAAFPGIRNDGVPFLKVKQDFGSLEFDFNLTPEISLTSTSGYYQSHADTMINGSFAGFAGPSIAADNIFDRKELSQELRLSSDYRDKPVNFTLGAYYQNGKVSNDFTLHGNTFYGFAANRIKGLSSFDINSFSAFGQLRLQASEQLELAGGARWTHEYRRLSVFLRQFNNVVRNEVVAMVPGKDRLDSRNWSPEFTITFKPSDTMTIFGAFKQAYKSGSFDIVVPALPASILTRPEDKSFGDEKVQGGEIGLKSRWMDRALSFDIAGYYYKYSGLQTGVNQPASEAGGLPILKTLNAGKARAYGIDMEAKYRPPSIDGLELRLAVNWNKTKFLELLGVPCYGGQLSTEGCNVSFAPSANQVTPPAGAVLDPATNRFGRYTGQNLAGIPFVRAPEWQVNFGIDYTMQLSDGMELDMGWDNQYSSSYLGVLGSRPDYRRPSFFKIDLAATLRGKDGRWSLGVIGNNITNKITAGYCSSSSSMTGTNMPGLIVGGSNRNAGGVDEVGCAVGNGRSIWLRAGFKI